MRLLGYYIVHTFVNCVKKLFRTWVAIVLGIVVGFGLLGGVIGVTLGALLPEDPAGSSYEETEEPAEEDLMSEEDRAQARQMLEVIAGGVILAVLLLNVYTGDKSGSKIFTMSDVNFLFTAPMRPQSVLLFREILQMGSMLVASLYLLFQLPNLLNAGLSPWGALALIGCWVLTLAVGRLLAVLTYTLAATHERVRRFIRPFVFAVAVLALLPAIYAIRVKGMGVLGGLAWAYGAGASRYVPVWGWLKGIVGFTIDGSPWPLLACFAGVILAGVLIIWLTWRMDADFYEDALGHAAAQQELMTAAAEKRTVKRKKDRADRLRRDGLRHGSGATVLLHKAIYNRHRFAGLGLLTGTGGTYFGLCALCAVAIRWVTAGDGGDCSRLLAVPAGILLVIAFFRNMGNPIEEELARPYIFLLPDSAFRKLGCALLAGSYNTLLDVFPGLLVAALVLGASPLEAVGWLVLTLTMDWMVSCCGLFLNAVLPSSLPDQIGAMLLLMLKLLVVILPAVLLVFMAVMWSVTGATLIVAAINAAVGMVCFAVAQALFHEGES